ncbi:MAG TPA: FtsX-like permease family protein [Anaerolineae bacterium]|nr:FtsX-like permease family protein [Anaerolineae bacterium]
MKRVLNQLLATIQLALRRTWTALGSHAAVALGVWVATTTICALILYAEAVNVAVLRDRLDRAHQDAVYDLLIKGQANLIDAERYRQMDQTIVHQVQSVIGLPVTRSGRHGWSKSLLIVPPGQSATGQRNQLPRTRFQFYAGVEDQIEVVEGRFPRPAYDPQDVVEVMITEKLAEKLGLQVGDLFHVEDFTGGAQPMQAQVRVAAIIRLRDPASDFWFYAPWFLDEAFTVPEETFFNSILLRFVPAEAEFTWVANYDQNAINVTNAQSVLGGLDVLRFNLTSRLGQLQFLTEFDQAIRDFLAGTFVLKALLIVLGAPVVGIALYYIVITSQLIVERQRAEIAVLKSRGSSNGQVVALFLIQGLLIVGLAALVAPLLALPLAQLIGKATTFLSFTDPRVLPVTLHGAIYGYAALAAALALWAILAPATQAARETIVTYRHSEARPGGRSFIHRYYLDLVLLILGGLGYRSLSQSGTIITRSESGGMVYDPLLLVTPIVLAAAAAFLALRLVPLLLRGLARLVTLTETVAPLVALGQASRAPARYAGLILLLTFTLALGLFTASVAGTFDRNYSDQALYTAGADLRTHEFDYDLATWRVRSTPEYLALPGVRAATAALRRDLIGREAQIRAQGVLLAVDPATFADVAWWRPDFAPSLDSILGTLRSDEQAVLVNPEFARRYQLQVGDLFDINVDGVRVDLRLAGTLGTFPTLYPEDGDRLVARLDYLAGVLETEPSEVWLRTDPRRHEQTIAALEAPSNRKVVIHDGHELAGVRKDDPLRTGLFGALSIGFVAASVLSVLGFLLYAITTIQSRALQFGVLRATGLSVAQLVGLLSTEQLTLIGVGIALGTALGAGAGWMFTRFLQVSIIAREAVPPFLIVTPWATIVRLYIILVIVFLVALAASVHLLRRMRVHAVLRLGEQ